MAPGSISIELTVGGREIRESQNTPKVSIIIPAYNVGHYVGRSIESALGQSYSNVEVIVVNDGSTDDTLNIVRSYECDSRLIVVDQANSGVSSARNAGIRLASGSYCLFLDGDDWLDPSAISVMVNRAEGEHGTVLVCCNREFAEIDESGTIRRFGRMEDTEKQSAGSKDVLRLVGKRSCFNIQSSCYKLFALNIIKSNNIVFNEAISNIEDGLFVFTYLCMVDRAVYDPSCLWVVLQRPGSATRVPFAWAWTTGFMAFDAMIEMAPSADIITALVQEKIHLVAHILLLGVRSRLISPSQVKKLRKELGNYTIAQASKHLFDARMIEYVVGRFFPVALMRAYSVFKSVIKRFKAML